MSTTEKDLSRTVEETPVEYVPLTPHHLHLYQLWDTNRNEYQFNPDAPLPSQTIAYTPNTGNMEEYKVTNNAFVTGLGTVVTASCPLSKRFPPGPILPIPRTLTLVLPEVKVGNVGQEPVKAIAIWATGSFIPIPMREGQLLAYEEKDLVGTFASFVLPF